MRLHIDLVNSIAKSGEINTLTNLIFVIILTGYGFQDFVHNVRRMNLSPSKLGIILKFWNA